MGKERYRRWPGVRRRLFRIDICALFSPPHRLRASRTHAGSLIHDSCIGGMMTCCSAVLCKPQSDTEYQLHTMTSVHYVPLRWIIAQIHNFEDFSKLKTPTPWYAPSRRWDKRGREQLVQIHGEYPGNKLSATALIRMTLQVDVDGITPPRHPSLGPSVRPGVLVD